MNVPRKSLRLLGIVLLIALIVYAGPRRLFANLTAAHAGWLLLGFLLNFPQLGLKALRWFLLVRWQSIPLAYSRAFLAYFSALLIGFLTPGRLGEMARAFALRSETGIGLARAFSSVVLDRVFDLYLLLVLGLLGFFRFALVGPVVSPGAFVAICFLFLIPLAFLNDGVARWTGARLAGLPPLRRRRAVVLQHIDDFASGLRSLSPARILVATLLTAASYGVFFLQCWCCARALGFSIPVVDLVLITAATNLIGFLPLSISNLGTREAALVFFLALLDPPFSADLAISWGLSQFLVLFVGGGLIGFCCWQIAPMGLRPSVNELRAEGEKLIEPRRHGDTEN